MSYYSSHNDLRKYWAGIDQCGIDDLDDIQAEAYRLVNRDIELGWYRAQCDALDIDYTETRFAASSLEDTTPCKALECFKLLELLAAALTLHPGTAESRDTWQEMRDHYHARYDDELAKVLSLGLQYDWDTTTTDDITPAQPRRLTRC